MKKLYGYVRVSTHRQAEKGVSLQEQRDAVSRWALQHGVEICEWFEEQLTAAKHGRPVFSKMVKNLREGKADGVVMHKIDRGARNLRDWADLGELIDSGLHVRFTNDALDLQTRGGRLSADIQAIVAADYIRNLREEIRKGLTGRLKAGLLPCCAPLGYLNTGKGNVKAIDPVRGPLIVQAFRLYLSGRHTLHSLRAELHRLGLRTRADHMVSVNELSRILNNPFYAGVIKVWKTGQTYKGIHQPLISMSVFEQTQARLRRRLWSTEWTHNFTFRGLIRCRLCERLLIGEIQKGRVYYRCHGRGCATKGFREDLLEQAITATWPHIGGTEKKRADIRAAIDRVLAEEDQGEAQQRADATARLGAIKSRIERLVDGYVDGMIDKKLFEERKLKLLEEQRLLEVTLSSRTGDRAETRTLVENLFELLCSAQQSYRLGDVDARRELIQKFCSNLSVAGKNLFVEPFSHSPIASSGERVLKCADQLEAVRTVGHEELARRIVACARASQRPIVRAA